MPQRDTVIFDLGGVLLDWNPRHLYRQLFADDEAAMEEFLATVCNSAWNRQQDAGRLVAEGCALLKAEHPDKAHLIDAYYARHLDMIAGRIEGTVAILSELRERGTKLYFLSNYSPRPISWRSGVSTSCPGSAAASSRVSTGSSSPTRRSTAF
jgi:2-haloacid dehalogenase